MNEWEKMRQNGDEKRLRMEAGIQDEDYFHLPGPPYQWREIEEHLKDLADYESGEMKSRPQPPPMTRDHQPWIVTIGEDGEEQETEPPTRYEFFHDMLEWRKEQPHAEPPRACTYCGNPTVAIWWFNSEMCWNALCGRAGWVEICTACQAWYPSTIGYMN